MNDNYYILKNPIFSKSFSSILESVLDFPNSVSLSKSIWKRDKDEGYVLTDEACNKVKKITEWAIDKFKLKNPKSRIVGSMCSNTYNDKSDIDIHMSADNITKENSEELNVKLISEFKIKFANDSNYSIKGHPFEVYFQYNEHQDAMSVGCYDVDNRKWISGPEIISKKFNPYEEYYDSIQKNLSDLTDDIRMHVLKCGEVASVILKIVDNVSKNDRFLLKMNKKLIDCTKKSRELFNEIRKRRSIDSNPKSRKDALEKRNSIEWKISDSSFKFLDKLGYIATLLSIAKIGEETSLDERKMSEKIIVAIHDNLFNKYRTGYADIHND